MTDFIDLFHYSFFQNALMAALLTSLIAGIVGAYIVARRSVFISGGITHASFGGIGLAYYLGWPPFLGAAAFAILSALGIEWGTQRMKIREDSSIAILWSLGMAIGIIAVFMTPGYTPNLMGFLFGDILTVNPADLIILAIWSLILLAGVIVFYRPVLYTAFDSEFAQVSGLPVKFIRYMTAITVAISIVLAIKVMGIILVLSLFTIPQATANLFYKDLRDIMWLSVLVAVGGSILGLVTAYFLDIPSGASIIFTLTLIYAITKCIKTILLFKS
ncbi:metal ABC transporter permease [Marinilabiliaceae bacterium JC017]|nr:metal ABC transporter permease [Marinilabiliaceae bacterium JC017]